MSRVGGELSESLFHSHSFCFVHLLTKSSHSHSPYSPLHLCFLLLSPAQHSIIMLIPSLPSFSPLQPEECQEYLQNSALFSQFLLILLTNCQECYKNSALFAQFLLTSLTYVLLSYFVHLHCANIHTPLRFFFYP